MASAHTQTNDAKRDATLVVAGCDAPKLFDTTKPSFDQITIAVKVFVEGPLTGRCKTPRNRANRASRYLISHDFIPGIGFPIPF